jgi:hypothetical protein
MIAVADLIADVGEFQYNNITHEIFDESEYPIGERCIEKAKVWIESRFLFCKQTITDIDWDDSAIKEAHLKRALYELWSFGEFESVAADKRMDSIEILAGLLGSCVYGSVQPENKGNKPVGGYVIQGETTINGFS